MTFIMHNGLTLTAYTYLHSTSNLLLMIVSYKHVYTTISVWLSLI